MAKRREKWESDRVEKGGLQRMEVIELRLSDSRLAKPRFVSIFAWAPDSSTESQREEPLPPAPNKSDSRTFIEMRLLMIGFVNAVLPRKEARAKCLCEAQYHLSSEIIAEMFAKLAQFSERQYAGSGRECRLQCVGCCRPWVAGFVQGSLAQVGTFGCS